MTMIRDSVQSLLSKSPVFKPAKIFDFDLVTEEDVHNHLIKGGMPMVIQGTTRNWDPSIFNVKWLQDYFQSHQEQQRNLIRQRLQQIHQQQLQKQKQQPQSQPSQLHNNNNNNNHNNNNDNQIIPTSPNLQTNQYNTFETTFLKFSCPPEWKQYIMGSDGKLPIYLRERGSCDIVTELPFEQIKPNTTIVNIDNDDLWSPGKRDLSGSITHNLMVAGNGTTYWFCTATSDRYEVDEFWREKMGGAHIDNELKQMFIPTDDLVKAKFPIYIIEQKVGDLVLLPSCSINQYFNVGGKSVKVTWNRLTTETLSLAYNHILPHYIAMKKRDVFNIKLLVYYAFKNRISQADNNLSNSNGNNSNNNQSNNSSSSPSPSSPSIPKLNKFINEMLVLHNIMTNMVWSEDIDLSILADERVSTSVNIDTLIQPSESAKQFQQIDNILLIKRQCFVCNSYIFNRRFRCVDCNNTPPDNDSNQKDAVDICLNCMSVSTCKHKSAILQQSFDISILKELLAKSYRLVHELLYKYLPGQVESVGKCFQSMIAPHQVSIGTIAYNQFQLLVEDGKSTCHQCKLARPRCKMAYCSHTHPEKPSKANGALKSSAITPAKKNVKCQKKYCGQCLWNRYSLLLVDCLKVKNWECLFCTGECNCSACLRKRKAQTSPLLLVDDKNNNNNNTSNSSNINSNILAIQPSTPKQQLKQKLQQNQNQNSKTVPFTPPLSRELIYQQNQQIQLQSSQQQLLLLPPPQQQKSQQLPQNYNDHVQEHFGSPSSSCTSPPASLTNSPFTSYGESHFHCSVGSTGSGNIISSIGNMSLPPGSSLESSPLLLRNQSVPTVKQEPLTPQFYGQSEVYNSLIPLDSSSSLPRIVSPTFFPKLKCESSDKRISPINFPTSNHQHHLVPVFDGTQLQFKNSTTIVGNVNFANVPSQLSSPELIYSPRVYWNQQNTISKQPTDNIDYNSNNYQNDQNNQNRFYSNNNNDKSNNDNNHYNQNNNNNRNYSNNSSNNDQNNNNNNNNNYNNNNNNSNQNKKSKNKRKESEESIKQTPKVKKENVGKESKRLRGESKSHVNSSGSQVLVFPTPPTQYHPKVHYHQHSQSQTPISNNSSQLVWARLGLMSNYFPARLANVDEIPNNLTYDTSNHSYIYVFGDKIFVWVETKYLYPFETGMEVEYLPSYKFQLAMEEAFDYKKKEMAIQSHNYSLLEQPTQSNQQHLEYYNNSNDNREYLPDNNNNNYITTGIGSGNGINISGDQIQNSIQQHHQHQQSLELTDNNSSHSLLYLPPHNESCQTIHNHEEDDGHQVYNYQIYHNSDQQLQFDYNDVESHSNENNNWVDPNAFGMDYQQFHLSD